ncbi:deoxyhypusine hydroxylase-like [Sycon ciliatum]|uniref:deoxyhypusine hydroxylase-like n=1 Tax=Sycon ciliatum TaxID=27933 RepID=UPI0020AD25CA|eukprot:scpid36065/ scgid27978/ Deoxyhypusine hydroxylase; Deoxyhypusine dioxygenase; Deoxyhypusine monooxygenase
MSDSLDAVGQVLNDSAKPLSDRFRALFTLRNLGGSTAVSHIAACFSDSSALLKHECAYCLGQMQDGSAVPVLVKVLEDRDQDVMVRHEAGEALGAIGDPSALAILEQYLEDSAVEVAETCRLALDRIQWSVNVACQENDKLSTNPYKSVDPAPPAVKSEDVNLDQLQQDLMNTSLSLFDRYRALFSLRNHGGPEAAKKIATGLKDTSALFRHEIAYVLGQMQEDSVVAALTENLKDLEESPMVRHECAEALGSIGSDECTPILQQYLHDSEQVVRESCIVALDIRDSGASGEFQYANTLSKVN